MPVYASVVAKAHVRLVTEHVGGEDDLMTLPEIARNRDWKKAQSFPVLPKVAGYEAFLMHFTAIAMRPMQLQFPEGRYISKQ